jgi:hypothetical protein
MAGTLNIIESGFYGSKIRKEHCLARCICWTHSLSCASGSASLHLRSFSWRGRLLPVGCPWIISVRGMPGRPLFFEHEPISGPGSNRLRLIFYVAMVAIHL